jgi:hypothetical protein
VEHLKGRKIQMCMGHGGYTYRSIAVLCMVLRDSRFCKRTLSERTLGHHCLLCTVFTSASTPSAVQRGSEEQSEETLAGPCKEAGVYKTGGRVRS